jgi:hypothetical protein
MAQDRYNAVQIGYGKDRYGFPCEVLKDTTTQQLMYAYDPDVWYRRQEFLQHLEELNLQGDEPDADTIELVRDET